MPPCHPWMPGTIEMTPDDDAPRRDEIVVAVVVTSAGRPLQRIGGLQAHEIVGEDGLR